MLIPWRVSSLKNLRHSSPALVQEGPLEMAAGLLFTKRLGLLGAITLAAVAKQMSGTVKPQLGRSIKRGLENDGATRD